MDELTLGVAAMDETHADFLRLLDAVKQATGSDFIEGFSALVEHTEAHFAMEEEMMRSLAYYGLQEHHDEHETLLSEMRYFLQKARKLPPFGRSYIDDYAYEKFRRHIINIDAQLAMFLKGLEMEAAHG
ncbi:bacteriohemerythrin [Thiomicrolovo sp. ZZH C-3]